MTLFPVEPDVIAPWLLVVRVLPPTADVLHAVTYYAHSVRQVEEIGARFVDGLEPGWTVTDAALASSPVRVAPSPRRLPVQYRS